MNNIRSICNISPHDEHRSSSPRPVKIIFGPVKYFSFYLEICKNKFKNLIWTGVNSNFHFKDCV